MSTPPKFRRRKDARPAEIVAAALDVFVDKGFAAARLEDIAAKAGVSKGAVYLYFETKQDVFRAVVEQAIAPNIEAVQGAVAAHSGPFPDLVALLVGRIAEVAETSAIGGVLKMVVGEARNFPELAQVWHDRLVARVLAVLVGAVEAAQARGEVRPGDPRHYALSLLSPLVIGVLWRETFTPVGARPIDLRALLAQHVETVLHGMLVKEAA
jgi:AcrR family transcriptional regulator